MAKIPKIDDRPHRFQGDRLQIGSRMWVNGRGPAHARCMIVGSAPTNNEVVHGKVFLQKAPNGDVYNSQADFLYEHLGLIGFPKGCTYYTNVLKYSLKKGEKPKADMTKECSLFLEEEIAEVDPEIIICLGAYPFENMYGAKGYFDISRGEIIEKEIAGKTRKLLGVFSLDQVEKHPEYDDAFHRDLKEAINYLNGTPRKVPEVDVMYFTSADEIKAFREILFENQKNVPLFLDSEWGGKNWQDPNRYFRTIQFSYARDKAVVVQLTHEGGKHVSCYNKMLDELKLLLEDERVDIVGHNIIADAEWLLSYGIDIRPRIFYDTMLAEFILKNIGPFGLDDLSMKYTDFGRYCIASDKWAKEHKADVDSNGYGNMPDEILLPYGAYDVCVLDRIMEKQLPLLQERGALDPRGVKGEYPSLFHTTMATALSVMEMEITGLPFDEERFKELVDAYQKIRADALGKLTSACANIGMPDINVNSPVHIRTLLFDKCGITPIKATNKKSWADAMASMAMDDDSGSVQASTDKDSLTMLEFAHPIVGLLLRYRRVSKPCDLFQMPDKNGKGGLKSYVWPDGRIHTRYSMLLATGRLSSSNPNVQNYSKKADAAMAEIFAPDPPPPSMRSFVKPPDGWVMMETDYSTAELHVLGNLSGDPNLLKALHTLGTDMHTMVAVDSFHLHMFDPDGKEWTMDDICKYAAELGSDTCEEFENFQKSLTYKNEHGLCMTHAQMKNGPRLAAKTTNFSIMYGIGAASLALKIKSSTGDERPLDVITAEMQNVLDAWKTRSFPVAWNTLEEWKQSVYEKGYIENAWGMRKWTPVRPGVRNADYERESANYCIQSLVSGTIQIATERLLNRRKELGLRFKLQNQIHDALMLEVPVDEIDVTREAMHWAMSEIDIPIYKTGRTFRLDSDTDIYTRWGEKMKH